MNKNNGHKDSTDKVMTAEPSKEELRRDCECQQENFPSCEGAFTSMLVVGQGGPMEARHPDGQREACFSQQQEESWHHGFAVHLTLAQPPALIVKGFFLMSLYR